MDDAVVAGRDQRSTLETKRGRRWAATMGGFSGGFAGGNIRLAHSNSHAILGTVERSGPPEGPNAEQRPPNRSRRSPGSALAQGAAALNDRQAREDLEARTLAPGATRASGAGQRAEPEQPDSWRTCFERDRDRVLHATAFRRLAGKTQVFVFPKDHQRTRLTHALEVAQVATSVAQACRLNVGLTEAIALGHDCGHGPGGHASEDALDPLTPAGFDHAPWGADVSLRSLNLCAETLDGIRNHSWSRPAPSTPEGEVVSWADRIAYVCHDWEDAVRAGVVRPRQLPESVSSLCGEARGQQLDAFIHALVNTTLSAGQVGMDADTAAALADFRAANYRYIYLREESLAQGAAVIAVLRALVHHYADRPNDLPWNEEREGDADLRSGTAAAITAAVTYVAGMTDRFAFRQAVDLLGWDREKLPRGISA